MNYESYDSWEKKQVTADDESRKVDRGREEGGKLRRHIGQGRCEKYGKM